MSAFDTEHLPQLGNDLDQVFLLLHHLSYVLVSRGDFVEDPAVLAALDTLGLLAQIVHRETPLRLAPAHPLARSMRCAVETEGIAQPADDERTGAHRPGD